jgi:hypothetical protein
VPIEDCDIDCVRGDICGEDRRRGECPLESEGQSSRSGAQVDDHTAIPDHPSGYLEEPLSLRTGDEDPFVDNEVER